MSLASDTKLRVFICDEHPILVAGVRSFLGRSPDIEVVGEASSAGAFLPLISEACPDIIIVDAVPGGISLIRCLVQAFPNARIICLSEQDDHRHIGEALAAGARAYVLKTSPGESLLRAVEALRRGGQYVEGQGVRAGGQLAGGSNGHRTVLSEREVTVLRLVAFGYSSREIATRLGLTTKSVETYKIRATGKLELHGRSDIIQYAIVMGWFQGVARPASIAASN